jgi:hypothetical protein
MFDLLCVSPIPHHDGHGRSVTTTDESAMNCAERPAKLWQKFAPQPVGCGVFTEVPGSMEFSEVPFSLTDSSPIHRYSLRCAMPVHGKIIAEG